MLKIVSWLKITIDAMLQIVRIKRFLVIVVNKLISFFDIGHKCTIAGLKMFLLVYEFSICQPKLFVGREAIRRIATRIIRL